jgi:hypothetical protein
MNVFFAKPPIEEVGNAQAARKDKTAQHGFLPL